MQVRKTWLAALALAFVLPVMAFAQADGGGQGGRGGRGGNRGAQGGQGGQGARNFDPAQMRERWMNGIKEQLGATDDEWRVLQPKVEKVMQAQRDTGRGGGPAMGGRGGRRGGDAENQTAVQRASADLRRVLEDRGAPAESIAKALSAYREARDKARADLAAAQKELKELLTARQEAVLVTMGMLE